MNIKPSPLPNRFKIHFKFRHEGKSHDCQKCKYKGATVSMLKAHIEEQQLKSRIFRCELCEHSSTNLGNLRKHKLYIHNRNRYNCNQCEFKTITLGILNGHKKTQHKTYSDILSKLEEKILTFDENKASRRKETKPERWSEPGSSKSSSALNVTTFPNVPS